MAKYQITAIAEYHFLLVLNPMMSNAESCEEFGPFPTREDLLNFYNSQKVEPYMDEGPDMFGNVTVKQYRKTFEKGGLLEWMNPLEESEFETPGYNGHGIYEILAKLDQVQKQYQIS